MSSCGLVDGGETILVRTRETFGQESASYKRNRENEIHGLLNRTGSKIIIFSTFQFQLCQEKQLLGSFYQYRRYHQGTPRPPIVPTVSIDDQAPFFISAFAIAPLSPLIN